MGKSKMLVDGAEVKNPLVVTLKKPVQFEGDEIAEINLSGLEELTCDDLIGINRDFAKAMGQDYTPMDVIVPEYNLAYDIFVAARVSGLPLEFFKRLSARESGALKLKIALFFNSEV